MGRNAAFGRPPASVRLRRWWDARSKTSRQNIYLALGVGALFVAIIMAATARDQSQGTRRVIASRPQPTTTLGLPTPSTVNIGDLGGSVTAADLFGLSTTTTTPAPATTAAPTPTRPAPTVATTEAPRPATTVANPDIIFSTVPPATTTTTQRPPPTTTTAPTTTVPPTTTTTVPTLPVSVPDLLPAG